MAGVAADNSTYGWAAATRRVQGGRPWKEKKQLEDEAQWPGRKMREISGSSLGLSEQPLPTVAETDYRSGEWESESDRNSSSLSSSTSSDSESPVLACSLACSLRSLRLLCSLPLPVLEHDVSSKTSIRLRTERTRPAAGAIKPHRSKLRKNYV